MYNFLLLLWKDSVVLIKSGVMNEWMNEWICVPHNDKLRERNTIQHTAHNYQIPLEIINTLKKKKPSNWLKQKKSNESGFHARMLTKRLTVSKNQGFKYKNRQHNK